MGDTYIISAIKIFYKNLIFILILMYCLKCVFLYIFVGLWIGGKICHIGPICPDDYAKYVDVRMEVTSFSCDKQYGHY